MDKTDKALGQKVATISVEVFRDGDRIGTSVEVDGVQKFIMCGMANAIHFIAEKSGRSPIEVAAAAAVLSDRLMSQDGGVCIDLSAIKKRGGTDG